MRTQTLIILLVILAVGGILAAVLGRQERHSFAPKTDYALPAVNADDIDRIDITAADESAVLRKTADGWQVNDEEADEARVKSFLASFEDVSVTGPVSTSGDHDAQFALDDAGKKTVTLKKGEETVVEIAVGKSGATPGTTYFRPVKNDPIKAVYAANKGWSTLMASDSEFWRDKTIWKFDDDVLTRIVATASGVTYEATKKEDGTWQIARGAIVKDATSLGASVNTLTATGFADSHDGTDTLVFYGQEDNELLRLTVAYNDDDALYTLGKDDGSDDIFEVSGYIFDRVWLPKVFEGTDVDAEAEGAIDSVDVPLMQ